MTSTPARTIIPQDRAVATSSSTKDQLRSDMMATDQAGLSGDSQTEFRIRQLLDNTQSLSEAKHAMLALKAQLHQNAGRWGHVGRDYANDPDTKLRLATLQEVRSKSRREFSIKTCPKFSVSKQVLASLGCGDSDFLYFLTRMTCQRDDMPLDPPRVGVEYDLLHFKANGLDEMHLRSKIHHDIAHALKKLNEAEKKIQDDGYSIIYAVSDAQLVLLMEYLRKPATSLTAYYDPKDYQDNNPTAFQNRYYVRTITDIVVLKAFEMLTDACIMFGVRQKGKMIEHPCVKGKKVYHPDCTFMAYAFFTDFVVDGKLGLSTELQYVKLSTQQNLDLLNQAGLTRGPDDGNWSSRKSWSKYLLEQDSASLN